MFGLAKTTEPPGHKPLVVNVVVVGLFEEEGIVGRRRSRIVGASPLARSR